MQEFSMEILRWGRDILRDAR